MGDIASCGYMPVKPVEKEKIPKYEAAVYNLITKVCQSCEWIYKCYPLTRALNKLPYLMKEDERKNLISKVGT